MSLLNTDFTETLEGLNSFRNDLALRCPFTDAQAEREQLRDLPRAARFDDSDLML